MNGGIWDILGIAPTPDETTIRRAYAAALKRTRPDEDPDGFRKLRGAYEAALRHASWQDARQQAPVQASEPQPKQESLPAPVPPAPDVEQRAAALIHAGDMDAAAALLLTVRGGDSLPLGPWMRLSYFLASRLAEDPAIPEAIVERIATDFGWYGLGTQPATPIVKVLRARIDAAHWIAALREDGRKWTRFFGNDKAAASAMMLGRGKLGLAGLLPPYNALLTLLSGLQAHGAWAARSLDADRTARLRKLALDTSGQRLRWIVALCATFVAFTAAGDFRSAVIGVFAMVRMRIAWLRQSIMLALLLVTATAMATASGDQRAVDCVCYCVVLLCAIYVCAAMVTLAKAVARGRLARLNRRRLMLRVVTLLYLYSLIWVWKILSPILQDYGLDDRTGPLALIAAGAVFVFIFNRASGGGSDSMPRW
jgi:hypothetical protein